MSQLLPKQIKADYIIKLLLIGDSGVGKTSLLMRFAENTFTPSFITTIGIDFKVKTLIIDGKTVKLQIWDTAGQERFRAITSAYYKGAQGIILIYDVTNQHSFDQVEYWVKQIHLNSSCFLESMLVGNKADLNSEKVVASVTGKEVADQYNMRFFESSAKDGSSVDEMFLSIVNPILKKMQEMALPAVSTVITVVKKPESVPKKCCRQM